MEKLAEAQIAAKQPENTLVLLADSSGARTILGKILARAGLRQPGSMGEALPLYEQLASDEGVAISHRGDIWGGGNAACIGKA